MSNLRYQPPVRPTQPGAGPSGAASVAAQFARMAAHEQAFQELQAHPPPLPQPFVPPLSPAEYEQAVQQYLERMMEYVKQVWDTTYEQAMGHIPEATFYKLFASHEPLHVSVEVAQQQGLEAMQTGLLSPQMAQAVQKVQLRDMAAGMPPSTLWLAMLEATSSMQCAKDLTRYSAIRAKRERVSVPA